MSPNTRDAIVRRRKQGFQLQAIAEEFDLSLPQVQCVLREAGLHPFTLRRLTQLTHEEKVRRRTIRELLAEGTSRHSLEIAFGKDMVEEAVRATNKA